MMFVLEIALNCMNCTPSFIKIVSDVEIILRLSEIFECLLGW
jgi:hypothetical protein